MVRVGVIGLGLVGDSIYQSFLKKGIDCKVYDKYKSGGIGTLEACLETDILFLALPTPYSRESRRFDKTALDQTCRALMLRRYRGLVVVKSTVEPQTTVRLHRSYRLDLCHNPEFLTARTCYQDFHHQTHIVLGREEHCDRGKYDRLKQLYAVHYPEALLSESSSTESESMKLFANSFYAVKVQFFNELFFSCHKTGCDFGTVRSMMLRNGWINPMHTDVPGPDGLLSYGGLCFPKDTNALNQFLDRLGLPRSVLSSAIEERDLIREGLPHQGLRSLQTE